MAEVRPDLWPLLDRGAPVSPVWETEAFADEMRAWCSEVLDRDVRLEVQKIRCWSAVWRVIAGDATYFAKQNCPGQQFEAALIQVVAYASLRGEAPTPAVARKLLDKLGPDRRAATPSVEEVLNATAGLYGLTSKDLVARDRRPDVARARKVAIYLSRELTGKSLPEIGRHLGGRDHSTILAAVRSLSGDLQRDPDLAQAVDKLRNQLQPTA